MSCRAACPPARHRPSAHYPAPGRLGRAKPRPAAASRPSNGRSPSPRPPRLPALTHVLLGMNALADRVAAEDHGLTGISGSGSARSRLLKLINKRGSERVLRDAHEKVWANALAFEPGPRAGTGRIRAGAGGASGTRRDQGGEASGGGPGAAEARGHGLRRPPASCGFLTGPDWLAVRPHTVCSVWHCTMESGSAAQIGGRT